MKITNLKSINTFLAGLFSMVLGFSSVNTFAADVNADDFIEEASAKGLAEIEAGKLAVQKSTSPEVKTFAKKMIEDHAASNKELRALATKKNVQIADEAELLSKAKAYILKQREGESFDAAYVNNQIDAHRATIKLFKEAAASTDEDVRRLAATSLPKLEHHLQEAEGLVAVIARSNNNIKVDDGKADLDD
jgi:putative membrane protein